MGMYTEIFVNVDLVKNVPEEVIEVIQAVVDGDYEFMKKHGLPERWASLFYNGSFYTPMTQVSMLTFNSISNQWSLLGKGDIKNYEGEIQKFFEYISDYSENDFLGYYRYEESDKPTWVMKS